MVDDLCALLRATPGTTRVLLDGADTAPLATRLVDSLGRQGRAVVLVRAEHFWRPAGERFEYGREDPHSLRHDWLDAGALRREVLLSSVSGQPTCLPALYDPERDRSARARPVEVTPGTVVVVAGSFLLGRDLPAELTVHLPLSPGALLRRGVPAWQLPAYADHDEQVRPGEQCDVLVRAEDRLRPAVLVRRGPRASAGDLRRPLTSE